MSRLLVRSDWKYGDLFRYFLGKKDIQSILAEVQRYPSSSFKSSHNVYRQGDRIERILLTNHPQYPRSIKYDTTVIAEYLMLCAYVEMRRIDKYLDTETFDMLSDIMYDFDLSDLDLTIVQLPRKRLEANLQFKLSDFDTTEYSRYTSDQKLIFKTISNAMSVKYNPLVMVSGDLIYADVKSDNSEILINNYELLCRMYKYGEAIASGALNTNFNVSGSHWLNRFMNNLMIASKGVGAFYIGDRVVPTLCYLGLISKMCDYYDPFGKICDNDNQLAIVSEPPVLTCMSLIFAPLNTFVNDVKILLPFYLTSDGTLSRTLNYSDLSFLPVQRSRLNLLNKEFVRRITANILYLPDYDDSLSELGTYWLFSAVCIYYGIEGTNRFRKTARGKGVCFSDHSGKSYLVDMTRLEMYFDELQKDITSYSVRRAYFGTIIEFVNKIYDTFRCQFLCRWYYNGYGPMSSKDYTDFFKYNSSGADVKYLKSMRAYSGVVSLRPNHRGAIRQKVRRW
uniref:HSP90h n=1 Tax=Olivavirus actinidiae TaxID=2024724 RepID=A0A7L9CBX9_9CLOS|nr:HSP90h [Actinidia virus 1]